ncbi:hypothetical protein SELMODRAFT_231680 [Selaginella moellendorffii]|uniref:ER membrane protein complex subunit 6 n=2 Tax=Selaginella moellendorffii TaxID=88036 RepID=D8RI99_SELML|nr:ER membrane protein complex subunit 6 [Selaginella moellendorffii]EFJ28208.1 hypothetical protein SELMODRAFT_231680 [Selaginella moellendorffii]|eukprot:XP_002970882.1 ER membrane protein complex subunit 6 [Selaginella moellendorffii]
MARAHDAADAKKADDPFDSLALSAENVQHNLRIAYYCRTFLSIVAGAIAGVLGLTGVYGFLCYFLVMLCASAGLAAKTRFNTSAFFDSWHRVAFDGFLQGLMSFVLFWTLVYDIVHIF